MSDSVKKMPPIEIPVEADVLVEFREGGVNITATTPGDVEDLPLTRIELTALLGLAAMSVGYNAHAQDLEEE